MTGELDPAERELILLVNKHGSPAAVRALAGLLNGRDAVLGDTHADESDDDINTWVPRIWRAETIYGEPLDPPIDGVRDVRAHFGYRKVTFTRADGSTVAYAREHADAGRATWRPV